MDEFSMFSAQSEEALSRVLSLTRKFGLFLTLAHQTFSQLSGRLQGALQNSQRIAFRLGRDDSVWAAPRFGSFDAGAIKHTVEDEGAQPRSHPLFWSIQETYEVMAKALEELAPREAYLRIHTTSQLATHKIRTATVRASTASETHLSALRALYGQRLLTPRNHLETGTTETPRVSINPVISTALGKSDMQTPRLESAVKRVTPLAPSAVAPMIRVPVRRGANFVGHIHTS
jgi:hypothetical protein